MAAPNHKVLGVAIVLVAAALGFTLMGREDDRAPEPTVRKAASRAEVERQLREGKVLSGPEETPFRLRYPDDWVEVETHQLPRTEPPPLAGLRRTNNAALLTVSVAGPVEGDLDRLARETRSQFENGDDLRLRDIRKVRVAAGPALYASFTREKSDQIQTALIVPSGSERSYRVDAAVRPEAQDAAAQVGAMLRTFDIADR